MAGVKEMGEKEDIVRKQTETRYRFAMTAIILTSAVIVWGDLSDGGEVAAFSFLGTVALGFGVAKFSEYWGKTT